MNKMTTMHLAESAPMVKYIAHREKIADLQAQAIQLEELIARKQTEIAEAKAGIPDVSHLTAQRQDLLADLALGKVSENEVAALNEEIATKTAERGRIASAAKHATEAAEHAIVGLSRRLEGVQQEIAALSELKLNQRLVAAVLKHHAEGLGAEYCKAAEQVDALYMRLMALSGLLMAQGLPVGIASHCAGSFEIPSFNLDSCKPYEMHNWAGNLFLANVRPAKDFQYATEEEREILHAAGLVCI